MASDYVLIRKSRNALSSVLHVLFNVVLGVAAILSVPLSSSWIIGFFLVLVSKWRTFAVRPRYLFLNLKSNLVDLFVGFSLVLLSYFSGTDLLPVHYLLTVLYIVWLVLIKPRTSANWTFFQALSAIFLGTTASVVLCASQNPALLVFLEFLIGYAAARHVLAQNNNSMDNGFPALIFATVLAEISLLAYSWLIVYSFPTYGIMIPQLSIILTIFAFMSGKVYTSVESRDGSLRLKEVYLPILFSVAIFAVIILGFSEPIFNV